MSRVGSILHLHVAVYADKRVQDVWKGSSGETVAKARKREAPQQVLKKLSGTVYRSLQFQEEKQKGRKQSCLELKYSLQDQRLSILLDCSSLNWSKSWYASKTIHCTSVFSSLRCYCPLQLVLTALRSQLMWLQQGWGTDHISAPYPLSWKDIKLH